MKWFSCWVDAFCQVLCRVRLFSIKVMKVFILQTWVEASNWSRAAQHVLDGWVSQWSALQRSLPYPHHTLCPCSLHLSLSPPYLHKPAQNKYNTLLHSLTVTPQICTFSSSFSICLLIFVPEASDFCQCVHVKKEADKRDCQVCQMVKNGWFKHFNAFFFVAQSKFKVRTRLLNIMAVSLQLSELHSLQFMLSVMLCSQI